MSSDLLPVIRAASSDLTPDELAAPLLVGVSGGPDSLALLHALWRWRGAGGPRIVAVHVDHRLRPESADEARHVAAWCAEREIPFAGRAAAFDVPPGANIEQAAREARYECFAGAAVESGAKVLALAHHADDQAETLLLHLLRGSGLSGLAGMPPIRRSGDLLDPICAALGVPRPAVWRPLLTVRRAEILAYCERWQLAPIHDPSNDDTTLRRNAVRHRIMPLLEEHFPGAGSKLAHASALVSADEAFLHDAAREAFSRCAEHEPGLVAIDRIAFGREHPALQRRLLRAAWSELQNVVAPTGLDADTIEAARAAILAGNTGSQQYLPGGILLILDRASAALGPASTLVGQLRRRSGLPLVEPGWHTPAGAVGTLDLGRGWSIATNPPGDGHAPGEMLHIPMVDGGKLTFRTWEPGDRIALPGGRGSRKLQDWFTDSHIPGYVRQHLPLLACGGRVLWIVGLAAFPPATRGTPGGAAISCRLLYNGSPVEPIQRR